MQSSILLLQQLHMHVHVCKKGIVISTNHLLPEFQVSEPYYTHTHTHKNTLQQSPFLPSLTFTHPYITSK